MRERPTVCMPADQQRGNLDELLAVDLSEQHRTLECTLVSLHTPAQRKQPTSACGDFEEKHFRSVTRNVGRMTRTCSRIQGKQEFTR